MNKLRKTDADRFLKQRLSVTDGAIAYRQLRTTVIKEGILDRSYLYYTFLMIFTFGGFFFSIYELFLHQNLFAVIFWSISLAFFTVQMAGLMHDAGHRSIFKSTLMNDIFGHIYSGFMAMGYNQWKVKHNAHHAHTNQEDEDPDVELPLLTFSEKRLAEKNKIVRFLCKYQAFLYYPFGSMVVFSVRIANIIYLTKRKIPAIWWEIAIYAVGLVAWFILPFVFFEFWKAALSLIVVNITAGLYLLSVFAPNHKGMPYVEKDRTFSFLEQQIMTSRNIHGNWLTDFIYMGLNYQIEHHLFPNCPRNKLKFLRPHIIELSKKLKLDYTEVSFLETNKIILGELHAISRNA